jgi:hypothetical protein
MHKPYKSYLAMTRFDGDPDWGGLGGRRYATPQEAEASLSELRARRTDLVETRIAESPYRPTNLWDFERNCDEVLSLYTGKRLGPSRKRGYQGKRK